MIISLYKKKILIHKKIEQSPMGIPYKTIIARCNTVVKKTAINPIIPDALWCLWIVILVPR